MRSDKPTSTWRSLGLCVGATCAIVCCFAAGMLGSGYGNEWQPFTNGSYGPFGAAVESAMTGPVGFTANLAILATLITTLCGTDGARRVLATPVFCGTTTTVIASAISGYVPWMLVMGAIATGTTFSYEFNRIPIEDAGDPASAEPRP